MFDVGWSEILVIVAVAVFAIGPKDIPKVMYQVGRFFRRLQYMKFAMSQQFDEILKAGDIEELRHGVNFEAPKTDERAADENIVIAPPSYPPASGGRFDEKSSPVDGGERGGD
jgi:Tat protein translocase TatB subunit